MFPDGFIESRLGVFPSPWDNLRFRVRSPTPAELEEIPDEYEGLEKYQVIGDQGNIGSCVGWCGEKVMEITNHLIDLEPDDLSAGWLYERSRFYANIPPWTEGSTNLGLMKALNKEGATTEKCCPTDTVSPFSCEPCVGAEEIAAEHAVDSYWQVNAIEGDMKAAIWGVTHEAPYKMPDGSLGKLPLCAAYPVHESFKEGYDNGIVPLPHIGDTLLGGHSSCVAGWKIIDGEGYWVNYNSWGKEVGDEGKFYLPFGYPFYDAWIIHNGPPTQELSDCLPAQAWASIYNILNATKGGKTRLIAVVLRQ